MDRGGSTNMAAIQSDDLFIRKLRRQTPRPQLASVTFEPKWDGSVRTRVWPPRREEDVPDGEGPTPMWSGPSSHSLGRSHVMQRSNSDVTLGELDASGAVLVKVTSAGCRAVGVGTAGHSDDSALGLHREYGSLNSLEKQTRQVIPGCEEQGAMSPAALRFKDPFLLLGLPSGEPQQAEEQEQDRFYRALSAPDGESVKPVKAEKLEAQNKKVKCSPASTAQAGSGDSALSVRSFAHHDVQSILFDLTEAASSRDSIGRKKNITSGASAASQIGTPAPTGSPHPAGAGGGGSEDSEAAQEGTGQQDQGDGNNRDLLLSCPHFRNETGGEERAGLGRAQGGLQLGAHIPNDAVSVLEEPRESHLQLQNQSHYYVEHRDLGALYYRKYFNKKEHQNFFGVDERLGPVAVSFRREEKEGTSGAQYNYRIIFRTTELKTLRGSVLEESVASATRHGNARGLSPKRLLEHIVPQLNLQCLRLASTSPKVPDTLLKLDEQGLNFQRKVGVMYCRANQSSEEDMYNNESAGPAFNEFLDLLGERVRLLGFDKYRAQLDTKTDSTGTHSLYTRYQDYEIMFHVSTMLPYTPNNTQQLLRKRHIGNDIVTIVFQEPGALPFTPKAIRSHFQHVFIVVQAHEPCTEHTYYSVAITRSKDIPLFGPFFPKGARFLRSPAFRDFLLAKAVNAENAAERSEKFRSMATRTRQEYLRDLAENYVTTTPIDSSTKFPLLSLAVKRKDKLRGSKGAELHSTGALVWPVMVAEGGANQQTVPCLLGVSIESVVLIERGSRQVVFNCCCRDVIGWKAVTDSGAKGAPYLDIFYERGELVSVSVIDSQVEDIREMVQRLELVTRGCEAQEVKALRDSVGQPGFVLCEDGFVVELQPFGYAQHAGLCVGARVVRLCGRPTVHLTTSERASLLRSAPAIQLTVIPPDKNGKPRRSFCELYQKARQDTEQKSGEGQCGEAWVLEKKEEQKEGRGREENHSQETGYSLLAPPSQPLLRTTSVQDGPSPLPPGPAPPPVTHSYSLERRPARLEQRSEGQHIYDNRVDAEDSGHIYENAGALRNATPDLILAVNTKAVLDEVNTQKQSVGVALTEDQPCPTDLASVQPSMSAPCRDSAERSSRTHSLHNSITKILMENADSADEEWQSISDLAFACRNILEALSREDQKAGGEGDQAEGGCVPTPGPTDFRLKESTESDCPGHLEDKVSQLEVMLKRLQDDLQKEKEDKAQLQAEVQSLRQNNQRLQEESQTTVARLIKVTELLCSVHKP